MIVTSQVVELRQATSSDVDLRPLSKDEGAALLVDQINRDIASEETMRHAAAISQALGGLPLSIVHVAGYVRQSRIGLSEFMSIIGKRQNTSRMFNESGNLVQYDKNLSIVHDIALQELDAGSLQLAQLMAMLSPEGIPEEMFAVGDADPLPTSMKDAK